MKRIILIAMSLVYVVSIGIFSDVQAQSYPQRPVQLVIPNIPGSIVDLNARILSDEIAASLGTQLIPINKPGAGMTLGIDFVARSKKDGYTIGYAASSSIVYNRILSPDTVPYDPNKDLAPLGLHLFHVLGVNVLTESPWKTFPELIDYARKNPGKLRVGTNGVGTIDHLNLEIVQSITGAQFTHVPFKGGEAITSALLGGHVEVTFDALAKNIPFAEAGKTRILLLNRKFPSHPQIPVVSEFGYKEELLNGWFAFYGPSGMPEEATKALVQAVEKAVKNPELTAKVERMGYNVEYRSPSEVSKLANRDYERANELAKRLGLRN